MVPRIMANILEVVQERKIAPLPKVEMMHRVVLIRPRHSRMVDAIIAWQCGALEELVPVLEPPFH